MSLPLPKNWAVTTLGDIRVKSGSSIDPRQQPSARFVLYSVPQFEAKTPEILLGTAIGSSKQTVAPGSVLLCKINPRINRVWVVEPHTEGQVIASTEWIPFFEVPGINPKYLAYYLQQDEVRVYLAQNVSGVGGSLMRVRPAVVDKLEFRLAPQLEQDRIVAEIEKQFTRLEDAVAALKRVQKNLKRYRASVFKAACEGHLVTTEAEVARKEGRGYEAGSELLKRILVDRRAKWETDQRQKMITSGKSPKNDEWKDTYKEPVSLDNRGLPSLPEGWTWTRVDQAGIVQLGRQRAPQHHTGKFMRPYLRVANVFEDRIEPEGMLEMNFSPEEFKTYELKPGDILLNEGQSLEWVGRSAIYNGEVPGACFQNTLVRFRAHDGVLPKYAQIVFLHYLHSKRFQSIARWTVNIAHLGAERFASLEFPLPPVAEQHRIVAAMEQLHTEYQHSMATLAFTSVKANQLRRVILEKAFSGKLMAQDPADEHASVLLERIRSRKPAQLVFSYGQKNPEAMPKKPAASAIRPRAVARSKKAGAP